MSNANLRILIVDDFPTILRVMRKLLKTIGYEQVDEAANGEEAYAKIQAVDYGLIISDWNMEPMTGFQLLQKVRADARTASIPFLLVTAESKADNLAAAKSAGVNGYLIKPFNEKTLREQVEAALAHAAPVAA